MNRAAYYDWRKMSKKQTVDERFLEQEKKAHDYTSSLLVRCCADKEVLERRLGEAEDRANGQNAIIRELEQRIETRDTIIKYLREDLGKAQEPHSRQMPSQSPYYPEDPRSIWWCDFDCQWRKSHPESRLDMSCKLKGHLVTCGWYRLVVEGARSEEYDRGYKAGRDSVAIGVTGPGMYDTYAYGPEGTVELHFSADVLGEHIEKAYHVEFVDRKDLP